jgi:hypothetical protein
MLRHTGMCLGLLHGSSVHAHYHVTCDELAGPFLALVV